MVNCPLCDTMMIRDANLGCMNCGFRLHLIKDKTGICILALRDTIKEMIV